MNNYNFMVAESRRKMGEEALERGSEAAALANFKIAKENYEKASQTDPSNKDKYLELAKKMEDILNGNYKLPTNNVSNQNNNSNINKPLRATEGNNSSNNVNKPEKNKEPNEEELKEALAELNELIGLSEVKTQINDWVKQIQIFQIRKERGLPIPPITYHMVFTGNPGTGKTTVARLIAKIYHALGIIRENKLKEVGREDLVAAYVGQTAIKTKEVINEALGGILFIDEAYTLKKEGNDFGQEAIDTLLKVMEDQRDEIAVIAAGYEEDMKKFINANAGLSSRFKNFINFADYNGADLNKIFLMNCKKRKYVLTDEAKEMVKAYLKELYDNRGPNFGNARDVRNLFENVVTRQAVRLSKETNITDEALCTIIPEDLGFKTIEKENNKLSKDEEIIKLTVRLEYILINKYNLDGDLFNMIEDFISKYGNGKDYNILHKLRMKRNNIVHPENNDVDFNDNDLLLAKNIIDQMENNSINYENNNEEESNNIFEYHGKDLILPPLDILDDGIDSSIIKEKNKKDIEEVTEILISKLNDFGIKVEVTGNVIGASISRIEMKLLSNTQLSYIAKYEADIAMVLKRNIRLLLPIEGKDLIGVEIENANREVLKLKEMLKSPNASKINKLNTGIGYDVEGVPHFVSFDSLPHALVGGSTGSGKSVFLSSVIVGLLFRYQPKDVRLVLVDFKRVEMNIYNNLPYIVGGKAIDEIDFTIEMFDKLTDEMERRYDLLTKTRTRNFEEYNQKVGQNDKLPAIVIIIDEYADMVTNKDFKYLGTNIQRIAQKARAAGMYMIIATQRPSAKVVDGVIKANLPSRIAFTVASHIDSMNILDVSGAQDLIGKGDMLFETGGYLKRLQAPFISTDEIAKVVDYIVEKN